MWVVVDLPQHSGWGRPLTYTHHELLPPGQLVQVPLGRREVVGLVWDGPGATLQESLDPDTLRPISAVFDALPPVDGFWRALMGFTADYYQRTVGEVALSSLPPEMRKATPAALLRRCERLRARSGPAPEFNTTQLGGPGSNRWCRSLSRRLGGARFLSRRTCGPGRQSWRQGSLS